MARRSVGGREAVIIISDSEDDDNLSEAQTESQGEVRSADKEKPKNQRKTRVTVQPLFRCNRISVYDTDVICLSYDQYINDTIIDFYLNNLIHNECTTQQALETHIFSTHFYTSLEIYSQKSSHTPLDESRMRQWTKRINLFTKNYVIIPINEPNHWYLCIICFPGGEVVNKRAKKNAEKPCILFFDSLGPSKRDKVATVLLQFLSDEHERIHGVAKVFNNKNMPNHSVAVAQQNNLVDCGVFVLQFVESFLMGMVDLDSSYGKVGQKFVSKADEPAIYVLLEVVL